MTESQEQSPPNHLSVALQSEYEYTALGSTTSFRLVVLKPGNELGPIKCNLKALRMEEAPIYEALSYVWGSNERTHTMSCNNAPMKITKSLDTALRILRKLSQSRRLWIDQICIDQNNVPERSK